MIYSRLCYVPFKTSVIRVCASLTSDTNPNLLADFTTCNIFLDNINRNGQFIRSDQFVQFIPFVIYLISLYIRSSFSEKTKIF